MDQEKYTLHWDTYSEHLRNILKEISFDASFADVTLVTDDKKQMKAHRNILSACSSVFKEILQIDTNNNHPVIYLRGIQHTEIESILQFIYLGEAKLYDKRINEFLTVAKNLDIRDLGKGIEDKYFTEVNCENVSMQTKKIPTGSKDVREESTLDEADDADNQHKGQYKTVSKDYTFKCQQCDKAYSTKAHLKSHIHSAHEGLKYICNQCEKQYTEQNSLTKHVKSAHYGVRYTCDQCDQQFTRQDSVTTHIRIVHEGVKYECNQCSYQVTDTRKLTNHIKSVHEMKMKYSCDQCYYHASTQSGLYQHIQSVHEGVRYGCDHCDHQAAQQFGLKTHIESVHEGVKYACNQCQYQGSKGALRIHLKSKHSYVQGRHQ